MSIGSINCITLAPLLYLLLSLVPPGQINQGIPGLGSRSNVYNVQPGVVPYWSSTNVLARLGYRKGNIVLASVLNDYITLHYITLHYITLHYITLHYIILYYIILYYIILSPLNYNVITREFY